ncbi:MAG: FtsX-like permease family protein [Thermoleophilaceae bacterium]|nr:FtsX-like permease family protein [Thermoleophilaceae bacterium]
MRRVIFWLRWSMRDLRRRWLQVVATALVMALGVAVFAGLGGLRQFREDSATASFKFQKLHDLRVTLADGDFVKQGELERAVRGAGAELEGAPVVQERLLAPTQIDGRPAGKDAVLTPGLLVGIPVTGDALKAVDTVNIDAGKSFTADSDAKPVAVLDASYAKFYDLPETGTLALAGGSEINYVGQGQSPQYFLITSDSGLGGESTLGVIYAPLEAVQKVAGRPGQVNEAEIRLAEGADPAAARAVLAGRLKSTLPGASVTLGSEEQTYKILYRDAKNDQRMFGFFGLLVLLGAAIAAFNLVSRAVEAERREIGVGMALGSPPSRLAIRPLMLGFEIAILGTLIGAALAVWISDAFASVFESYLPLSVWTDPFSVERYLPAATIAFLIPFLAIIWPVWRAVRVQPVEAIRVNDRSAQGGMVRAATRIHFPGGSIAQMPWRNTSRTPRRTGLAVVGLAAVIGAMVALLGIIDSYSATIDQNRAELAGDAPSRLNVTLDGLHPTDSAPVRSIENAPGVERATPRLDVPAQLNAPGAEGITAVVTIQPTTGGVWQPTYEQGRAPQGADEIAIAPKAADDLGVKLGDRINVAVVGRGADGVTTDQVLPLTVSGLTSDPFRVFAFADTELAQKIGLAGASNALSVIPEQGMSIGDLQRSLATSPIVVTTRPVTADADALSDQVDQFKSIIRVAAFATFLLALLMAFNLASISIEERRREFATMFAYGMPVRRALGIAAGENLIIGLLGTLLGIGIGLLAIGWMISALFADTWPELGLIQHLSLGTILTAIFAGVLAVTIAPLLLVRRLTRMDVPSTLRVVE